MADIDDGLYVTELMGSSVNMVTGDYSRGAGGFWIENGRIAWPVSDVTVAGHLLEMFARLVPANDLEFRTSVNAPDDQDRWHGPWRVRRLTGAVQTPRYPRYQSTNSGIPVSIGIDGTKPSSAVLSEMSAPGLEHVARAEAGAPRRSRRVRRRPRSPRT